MKAGRVAFARLALRGAGTSSVLVGRLSPYLLVLPTVCLVATFVWYPLLRAVQASLYQWDGVGELGRFVALANYQRMFLDDPIFRNALRNTLLWAVMYTVIPT